MSPVVPQSVPATIERVEHVIKQRPVIWVGAGASIAAGYPSTNKLVEEMRKRAEIEAGALPEGLTFEQTADAFVDAYGKGALGDLLQELIGVAHNPTPVHRAIAKWAADDRLATIVTTNYDDLLERSLADENVQYVLQAKDQNENVVGGLRLLKVHGTRDNWKDAVLSGQSYEDFNARYQFVLAQLDILLRQHWLLYVGCSMTDPRILDWLAAAPDDWTSLLKPWRVLTTKEDWRAALEFERNGATGNELLSKGNIKAFALRDHGHLPQLFAGLADIDDPSPVTTPSSTSELYSELADLERQRETLVVNGESVHDVLQRILEIRRAIRSREELQEGSVLLNRFRLVEKIGYGGFATVWKGYDKETKKRVAVKVLHAQWSKDESRRKRFFRGARKMGGLQHESIVQVVSDNGEHDGHHFFVMEYVEGGDLRERILRGDGMSSEEALECILGIARALEHAHSQGVIHRDIKPANILLDGKGLAKLTDFDLVDAHDTTAATRTGMGMGSFGYAAPECQRNAKVATPGSDVYSLGVTAIFALRGEEVDNDQLVINAREYIADAPVDERVKDVISVAVRRSPDDRYSTMREFQHALRKARQPDTPPPKPPAITIQSRQSNLPRFDCVAIPAGTFWMGAQKKKPDEPGYDKRAYDDESPVRQVQLSEFRIARHPTTVKLYQAFLDSGGYSEERHWVAGGFGKFSEPAGWSEQLKQPKLPVVGVSWYEAMAYCAWSGMQLPTEAQWEYAARAGTTTRYWWGDEFDGTKCHSHESGIRHPVSADPARANPWGLVDMLGNVWEWCYDGWKDEYDKGHRVDPVVAPDGASRRVYRGGGWGAGSGRCRAAYRVGYEPRHRFGYLGFRVAAVPPSQVQSPEPAKPRAEARRSPGGASDRKGRSDEAEQA